jgi:hypothetical protein
MKTLIEKLKSRKLLTTLTAYAVGAYLIKTGNITEGVAMITGAQVSYNVGQGIADAKPAEG